MKMINCLGIIFNKKRKKEKGETTTVYLEEQIQKWPKSFHINLFRYFLNFL